MTNITSSYYQIPTTQTGGQGVTGGQSQVNVPSLASALAQVNSTSPSSSDNSSAYLLDLSPTAQQYLSGLNIAGVNTNSLTAAPSASSSSTGTFTLSTKQQQEITDIIAKYKDAPQTQDTFNQIQNDLQAAGLSPQQLSQMDKSKSFNATQLLIDDLNGKNTDLSSLTNTSDSAEQSKAGNFMQQVYSQWKTIASAGSASDSVTPTSGTGGA